MENQSPSDSKPFAYKKLIVLGVVAAVLVGGYYFYVRSLIFAASVNGSMITRLDFIKEMEKQDGSRVLESLVTDRLIESAVKDVAITTEEVEEEIKKIEESITQQGGTLAAILTQQGMTEEDMRKDITIRKKVQKLLADKIQVTEEEVKKYIADYKVTLEKGKEDETKNSIKSQLESEKFSREAQSWVLKLKTDANIKYYWKGN